MRVRRRCPSSLRAYLERLAAQGLKAAGKSPDGGLCETVELEGHPWFFGCQFHPEYKSKPNQPHPVFVSFVRAALEQARGKRQAEDAADEAGEASLASSVLQVSPGGVSPES